MLSFSTLILGAAALLFVCYWLISAIYLSPLSKLPRAHWSSSVLSIWILWLRFKNLEGRKLHQAHMKLGPIIQIAPNEISVNDQRSIRTIYHGIFDKSSWYSVFDNYGVPCMFSTQNSSLHSARRKMIQRFYSKSVIQSSSSIEMQSKIIIYERLLPLLSFLTSSNPSSEGIDIQGIWNATAMDLTTAYLFGIKNSSNFLADESQRNHWFDQYKAIKLYTFFPQELPRLTNFLKRLHINLVPRWIDDAKKELEAWTKKRCDSTLDFLKRVENTNPIDPACQPVIFKAMIDGIEKENNSRSKESILTHSMLRYPELSIASEMIDHLSAGHETMGAILTDISWHLSQRPSLQAALRSELLLLNPSMKYSTASRVHALPCPKALDALPLLNAIVMETLRKRTANTGRLPRVSPYPSCTLGAHDVPENVNVEMQLHSVHRNAIAFPEPETWDHMRWLDTENQYTKEQREARDSSFYAFGIGSRLCIGKNFAMHEIKLVITAVYINFRCWNLNNNEIRKDSCTPTSRWPLLGFEMIDDTDSR